MSYPLYTCDPCNITQQPCGACSPYANDPCAASCNNIQYCSKCPGGGCSYCPAPVRPCPEPPIPLPYLPCQPACPSCDRPRNPVPPPMLWKESLAIPNCRPNRCKPCPCYSCSEPGICSKKRCSYPGTPVCCGSYGPCMPVW